MGQLAGERGPVLGWDRRRRAYPDSVLNGYALLRATGKLDTDSNVSSLITTLK